METCSGSLLEVCRNWDVISLRELCGDLRKMGPWMIRSCVHCHTPAYTITEPQPWANRSPTSCHTPCSPSGLYRENRDSSMKSTRVPDPVECEHLSTRVGYTETLTRTTSMQTSFPQTASDSSCGTSVVIQAHCCLV